MSKLTFVVALLALFALVAFAQNTDPNIEYDANGTPVNYIFSFRIPLNDTSITTIPASCTGTIQGTAPVPPPEDDDEEEEAPIGFITLDDTTTVPYTFFTDNQYLTREQVWIEVKQQVVAGVPRYTYLALARKILASKAECFNGINADEATWKENFVAACKFRDSCGGSTPCACMADAPCKNTYTTDAEGQATLISSDYCVPAYLCVSTTEGSTDGTCQYARQPFKLTAATQTVSETAFWEVARSSTCSLYNIDLTYILKQAKEIYFSATYSGDVSETCLTAFSTRFGGTVAANTDTACQAGCGGKFCICEQGNLCNLQFDEKKNDHKQCIDKLKCEMVSGVAICNNSVMISALFALICASIAVFF